jgi:hypothetical protein
MSKSYSCLIELHTGCGNSPITCTCSCHQGGPVTGPQPYTPPTEEFPDRNLDVLRERVASGVTAPIEPEELSALREHYDSTTQALDGGVLESVADLEVGTVLLEQEEHVQRLWVRIDDEQMERLGQGTLQQLVCVYVAMNGAPTGKGIGTRVPADAHTSLRIVGALPGTPAAPALG